jgi:hypothetical protein
VQTYSFQIVTSPPQLAGTVYSANGLPDGLSIDSGSGIVSGTTLTVGTFKGTLYLTYDTVASPYPFQITVDPAPGSPVLSSPGAAVGTVGTPFVYTIEASGSPTSYNIAELPPGLTASGDQIAGTPTAAGLYFTSVSAQQRLRTGRHRGHHVDDQPRRADSRHHQLPAGDDPRQRAPELHDHGHQRADLVLGHRASLRPCA